MSTILEKQSTNLSIRVTVSDDKLKLFIDLDWATASTAPESDTGPESQPPAQADSAAKPTSDESKQNVKNPPIKKITDSSVLYAEVLSALTTVIRKDRLNTAVILHAVKQLIAGEPVSNRRVAKGSPPEDPRDGRLVFLVKKISNTPDLQEEDSGSVNLRQLRLFENIEEGQIVARLYPPRPGADGEDVFGKKIPGSSGDDLEVTVDETLELKPPGKGRNYSTIQSRIEGYLLQEGNALSIRNELIISGNVDYKTGNIDFIGSVKVLGDVLPGFIVRAKKDIFIEGLLDGGTLVSTTGAIEVAKLVAATTPSHINAATNATLSIVQSATVHCGELLTISKEARGCEIKSHSSIQMPQAELIGGTTSVICGLDAKNIGHESGVKTVIRLCSDIEMDGAFKLLVEDITRHESALSVLKSHLGPYAERPDRVIFLKDDLKEKIVGLLERFTKISNSYNSLIARRDDLLSGSKTSEVVTVSFSGKLYPGVEIVAGEHTFTNPEDINGPKSITYNTEAGEFSVTEYQAVACQFRDTTKKEVEETKTHE